MKRILTFVLLYLSAQVSFAQFGIKGGMNLARISGNDDPKAESSFSKGYMFGLSFGGFRDKPGLKLEILLSRKGNIYSYYDKAYFYDGSLTYEVETSYRNILTYLQAPLLITYPLTGRLYLEAGPDFAIRLGGKRKGETIVRRQWDTEPEPDETRFSENVRYGDEDVFPNFRKGIARLENKKYPDANPVSTFDLGWSAGIAFKLTGRVVAGIRYNMGLTDVFRNDYPVVNSGRTRDLNQAIMFSLSFLGK